MIKRGLHLAIREEAPLTEPSFSLAGRMRALHLVRSDTTAVGGVSDMCP